MDITLPSVARTFKAAQTGDVELFQSHINKKGFRDLLLSETHHKSGDTFLHIAVRNNNLALTKFLIEAGLNPEIGNYDGKTALHEGAQFESILCVKYLLSLNVKINSLKRADWTPLMLACTKPNLEMVNILLNADSDVNLKNKDGWNSFHIAVREGHLQIIQALFERNKSLSQTVSKNGRSPLHTAALHGNLDVVEYLLSNCCYETDMKDSCGSTPLMDAFRTENIDIAKILISQHKADVHLTDNLGRTSIHLAAQSGAAESIRYLVNECTVRPDCRCVGNDVTALQIASKEGHHAVLLLLLSLGVEVNAVDNKGRTALHIASGAQHAECVKVLLQNSAEVSPDKSGTLPQQLAMKPDVIQMFNLMGVT